MLALFALVYALALALIFAAHTAAYWRKRALAAENPEPEQEEDDAGRL